MTPSCFMDWRRTRSTTGDLEFTHVSKTFRLKRRGRKGTYDVTAISFHAYAYIADKYALLPHGASIGDNYGPIVCRLKMMRSGRLISKITIAVPGTLTSAFLALKHSHAELQIRSRSFRSESSTPSPKRRVDAGLLIHEGQLFYEDRGLRKVLDWANGGIEHTGGLPLPMGGNVIRTELGRRNDSRSLESAERRAFVIRSTIVRMLCSTRCNLPARWIRRSPIVSSRCG